MSHHHPATLMWTGFKNALKRYYNFCLQEWVNRGYVNRMEVQSIEGLIVMPGWWGDERLHASHRSNLLRKDPDYYGRFGWKESPDLSYFWPSREGF
ncbi:MAG: hypothetical protein NTW14_05750 [bacterium]|nr:hypothetical protein [bacterium]